MFLLIFGMWYGLSSALNQTIVGDGATSPILALSQLSSNFRLINSDIVIDYDGSNAVTGSTNVQEDIVDFAVTLSVIDRQTYPSVVSFPFLASPFSFLYHLPALPRPLILSQEIIVGIFFGRIRYWLDPELVALNPSLMDVAENHTIDIVLRGGTSGTLQILNNLLSSYSPEWNSTYGSNLFSFPADMGEKLNVTFTPGDNYGLFVPLYTKMYTFTFASISLGLSLYLEDFIQYADIINNGTILSPDYSQVQNSVESSSYDTTTGTITPGLTENSWPISTYVFIGLKTGNNFSNCDNRRNFLKFFRWVLLSDNAGESLYQYLYVSLSQKMTGQVMEQLNLLTCDNQLSLAPELLLRELDTPEIILLVLTTILIIFSLSVGVCVIKLYEKTVVARTFHIILIAGTLTNFFSVIFWSLQPSLWVCEIRKWSMFMGVTLLLGSVFCRTWQLKDIHKMVQDGQVKKRIRHDITLRLGMAVVMLIQFIILLTWTAMDPFTSTLYFVDYWDLIASEKCSSEYTFTWFTIEAIFWICILIWGIYVIYRTWNMRKNVNDSRMMAMAIYVCLMLISICFFLLWWVITSDEQMFYWAVGFLVSITLCLTFSVYLPRVVRLKRYPSQASHLASRAES